MVGTRHIIRRRTRRRHRGLLLEQVLCLLRGLLEGVRVGCSGKTRSRDDGSFDGRVWRSQRIHRRRELLLRRTTSRRRGRGEFSFDGRVLWVVSDRKHITTLVGRSHSIVDQQHGLLSRMLWLRLLDVRLSPSPFDVLLLKLLVREVVT